eukprot:1612649-Pyramimonas_sp.AAC.1
MCGIAQEQGKGGGLLKSIGGPRGIRATRGHVGLILRGDTGCCKIRLVGPWVLLFWEIIGLPEGKRVSS